MRRWKSLHSTQFPCFLQEVFGHGQLVFNMLLSLLSEHVIYYYIGFIKLLPVVYSEKH